MTNAFGDFHSHIVGRAEPSRAIRATADGDSRRRRAVTVTKDGQPATVYADEALTTPVASPVTDLHGRYDFYVAAGTYEVTVAGTDTTASPMPHTWSAGAGGVDEGAIEAAVEALVDAAPGALNTLNELAAALGDDASFASTVATALAAKAPLASPTFTGVPTSPALSVTGLTGSVAASRYVGATASGAPASGAHLVGDWIIDQTAKVWICTVSGTPGTWVSASGSSVAATVSPTGDTTGQSDYLALTAAVAVASAAGGGIVLLTKGTFTIWRTIVLPSNVELRGMGRGLTIITKPASIKTTLSANAALNATSVTVTSAAGFAVGQEIHLYDTSSFEWAATEAVVTSIVGNVISFTNLTGGTGLDGALQTARTAAVSTSYPLLRNVQDATNIRVRDLTLDQNANANDPAVADFTISTIEWEVAYYCMVIDCDLVNACGDTYSDQSNSGQPGATTAGSKATKNTIRGCRIRNAGRHGVHLGSQMNGAFVVNNEITSCAGFAVFYCADVTYTLASGNLVEACGSGFAGIDQRDFRNTISNNIIKGTVTNYAIDLSSSGSDGTGGQCVIANNIIQGGPQGAITVDQPDCVVSGNVIDMNSGGNFGIKFGTSADRSIAQGNQISNGSSGSGAFQIDAVDDVRLIGNSVKSVANGAYVGAAVRLVAIGNQWTSMSSRTWYFNSGTSVDVWIKDDQSPLSTAVTISVAATRLIYNGLGDNTTNDPASAGGWNAATGHKYDGVMVRWNSGGGEKVSIYFHGVGWTALN